MTATAAPPVIADDQAFCRAMLPRVSRTFAICIRLLPSDLEYPVLLAYLLCRVADTLEDTTRLSPSEKAVLLDSFSRGVAAAEGGIEQLREAFSPWVGDDELLVHHADAVLREFGKLSEAQRAAIVPWVQEMCAGMATFAGPSAESAESAEGPGLISTMDDLDRYCYYVAGTVGHMLTELFSRHHPSVGNRYDRLKGLATSFGLGLQLTNIIKDVADDRRRGRIFVPRQLCQAAGISPDEVQDPVHVHEARQVMDRLIDKAKGHLCDALRYSTSLPRREYRIRAFCLTSLYFAVRTLRLAQDDGRLLRADQKLKITRAAVRRTVVATKVVAPVDALVRAYFRHLAGPEWWQRCCGEPSVV